MTAQSHLQTHHIIPLDVFNSLPEKLRPNFHKIYGSLQKEDNFIILPKEFMMSIFINTVLSWLKER